MVRMGSTRRAWGMLLACLALGAVTVPAPAARPGSGTLTPSRQLVTWRGSFPGGRYVLTPVPEVRCLEGACDIFRLRVALGPGFWRTNGAGAVEVAIRWAYDGVTDLDLLVVGPDGRTAGRSAAVDSNAESVFIPNARDGVYTVKVSPSNTVNPDAQASVVPYEGLAQVEFTAPDPPGHGRPLLPNLRPLPPDGFHIATALNYIPVPENPLLSCYPEETIQRPEHPLRCLRFNQTIANIGEGPFLLRFALSGLVTPWPQDNRVVQRVVWSDGTYRDQALEETYQFHSVHAHLHYRGFGQTQLFRWSPRRGRVGEPVTVGHKVGFCVIDVLLLDEYWGRTGNGPRAHTFPFSCFVPKDVDLSGPEAWVEEGVQVGWADVYGWNLADQYIDITDVPDGVYELVQIANPNAVANPVGYAVETTTADNCASTVIRLQGDRVETLESFPSVPCPPIR
jgi:hypothetical protein